MNPNSSARRPRASISPYGTNMLHLRNPWIIAFWSFAFPGCGHLMLGRLAQGLTLIIWELVVNTHAKINLGILYSLIGQFDQAKQIINLRWFLAYVTLYIFSIWDSYRATVDLNKLYMLSDREDASINPFAINTNDANLLDKRNPLLAAIWSLLAPGLGHLYAYKIIIGLFFIAWTIVVIYFSHGLQAVHESFTGVASQAKKIVDMEWLMYLPSIYGFVIHDAYLSAVEYNKLLEKEQSKFIRAHYQHPASKMPL